MKYFIVFAILMSQSLICMESAKKTTACILYTDENPPKNLSVPLRLAMQCGTIKDAVEELATSDHPFPFHMLSTCVQDLLRFTAYTTKIYALNQLPGQLPGKTLSKTEITKQRALNKALSSYIKSLPTLDLINLSIAVDYCNVLDRNNNCHLIDEVVDRVLQNPNDLESFSSLRKSILFPDVLDKISKIVTFIPDKQSQKTIPVPRRVAMQCQIAKDMVGDIFEDFETLDNHLQLPIPNACSEDLLRLISYTTKIYALNQLPKNLLSKPQKTKQEALNEAIISYIQTLSLQNLSSFLS